MSCSSLVALARPCGDAGLAGLTDVYMVAHKDLTPSGSTTNSWTVSTGGVVDTATIADGKKFVKIDLLKSTSGISETLTKNNQTATAYFTQSFTLVLGGLSPENQAFVKNVTNQPVAVIVKTRTDKYFVAGLNGQMELTGAEGGTGVAEADLAGYTLTFEGISTTPILPIDPDLVGDLT